MKKILLILGCTIFLIATFFIIDIWKTIQQKPNITFGHILLKDRNGKIITDK